MIRPPIYTLEQVFADPQVRGYGLVQEQEHPAYGAVRVLGLPLSLSRTPPAVRTPAPVPGAHTREVLASIGCDRAAIADLAAAGVGEVMKP